MLLASTVLCCNVRLKHKQARNQERKKEREFSIKNKPQGATHKLIDAKTQQGRHII